MYTSTTGCLDGPLKGVGSFEIETLTEFVIHRIPTILWI